MSKVDDISQPFGELLAVQQKMEAITPPEDDPWTSMYDGMGFVGDVTGAPLRKEDAVQARKTKWHSSRNGEYTQTSSVRRGLK